MNDKVERLKRIAQDKLSNMASFIANKSNYVSNEYKKASDIGLNYGPPQQDIFRSMREKIIEAQNPLVRNVMSSVLTPSDEIAKATENFYNNNLSSNDVKSLKESESSKLQILSGFATPIKEKYLSRIPATPIPKDDIQDLIKTYNVYKKGGINDFMSDTWNKEVGKFNQVADYYLKKLGLGVKEIKNLNTDKKWELLSETIQKNIDWRVSGKK